MKWRFSEFYGAGAVAGFTPDQIDRMTLWEFAACMDGLRMFHGGKARPKGGDMSEARLAELGVEGF